jgi:hypothetical protein
VSESRACEPGGGAAPAEDSLTVSKTAETAGEVAAAIEAAWGTQLLPGDPVPGEVLAIGERLGLPVRALCRWIWEFAKSKRDAGYPITSPRLFVVAAGRALVPWARANPRAIEAAIAEERSRRLHGEPAPVVGIGEASKEGADYGEVCELAGERARRAPRRATGVR